jgi:hypothetical protein
MRTGPEYTRSVDSAILLFLAALVLFVSPFTDWWARDDSPWYLPYLLWLGLIGLIAAIALRRDSHDL